MKDLTPKVDNTAGATGQLTAAEFNDMRDDAQNVVLETNQTLTATVAEDNRQLLKGMAIGGARIILTTGQTAQLGQIVLPQNVSAAVTINLPPIGDLFDSATVYFEQILDQPFSVNNLIVGRNGQTIMNGTDDILVNTDNLKFRVMWDATLTTWILSKTEVVGTTL